MEAAFGYAFCVTHVASIVTLCWPRSTHLSCSGFGPWLCSPAVESATVSLRGEFWRERERERVVDDPAVIVAICSAVIPPYPLVLIRRDVC